MSDTIWTAAGQPAIPYGLRGLMGFTVALQTGAKDVHSGTTAAPRRNPIGELCALIDRCYDAKTGRVKIPGFYDDVAEPTAAERAGFARTGLSSKRFKAAHQLSSLRPAKNDVYLDAGDHRRAQRSRCTGSPAAAAAGASRPSFPTGRGQAVDAPGPNQKPAKIFKPSQAFMKRHADAVVSTKRRWILSVRGWAASRTRRRGGDARDVRQAAGLHARGRIDRRGAHHAAALKRPITFMGLSLPEHGYHAVNENYDWTQASGGMEMFCRYFTRSASLAPPHAGAEDPQLRP